MNRRLCALLGWDRAALPGVRLDSFRAADPDSNTTLDDRTGSAAGPSCDGDGDIDDDDRGPTEWVVERAAGDRLTVTIDVEPVTVGGCERLW